MECTKLFYTDPMLQQFTATVTGCVQTDKGWEITLDATAFYPEGGGQACDTGRLGTVSVLDVRERGEEIIHLCDSPLAVGAAVEGALNWARRFDLMQQHTGEHILSGLIHRTFGYHNVGFHMGTGLMEVDFDGPITPQQLAALEAEANAIVWDDRAVSCTVPSPEALTAIPYRSKKQLPWPVRIVEVPGADICACCGVHVPTTGRVGLIKIFSCTPLRGGVRLEMACGGRALAHLSAVWEQNRLVSQTFSAKVLETGAAAQRAAEALAAEKLRANTLQTALMDRVAGDYVNQNNVLHFAEGLDSAQLRTLAEKICAVCTGFCALFCPREGGYSYCLAQPGGDLRQLCKDMNAALNGRGGGKPAFQQGTVAANREEIGKFFDNLL